MYQVGGKGGRYYGTLDEANAAAEAIRQRKGIIVCVVEKPEPEPKPRPHYHIGNGNPGCLFDSVTGPYTNHRDAERAASQESRDYAADIRDADPGAFARRFVLKDAKGRPAVYIVEHGPYGSQYYWEISPCDDPECFAQEEY